MDKKKWTQDEVIDIERQIREGGGQLIADMRNADLSGLMLDFVNLSKANLEGADFTGASLNHAILVGANLTGAKFTGCKMQDARLREVVANKADFSGAFMYGVVGILGSFKVAVFTGADLRFAEFNSSDLRGANFDNCRLGRMLTAGAKTCGTSSVGCDYGPDNGRFDAVLVGSFVDQYMTV